VTDSPLEEHSESDAGGPRAERDGRFLSGLDRITRRGPRAELLLAAGAVLIPAGIVAIIIGWKGAADTGYVFEQMPFVMSGAALGVALVFVGGFCFFAYWLTVLVAETRRQSQQLAEQTEAILALQETLGGREKRSRAGTRPRGTAPTRPESRT
jgi:hypothetical protein